MPNYLIAKVALTIVAICFVAISSAAQGTNAEPIVVNGNSNEDSKANLDALAQVAGEEKLIIMIARLSNRESSRRLSRQRLQTARSYLENVRAIPTRRIVIAEGEPVTGFGRIEAYMDGKLYMIFIFERNRNFAPEQ